MPQGLDPRWQETADALGLPLEDLLTLSSFETAGSLDPMQAGPTTKWGQHRGLIQFGEPQAKQYGVDFSSPEAALASQLGADGAIVKYMLAHGFEPGMSGLDAYSTVNAGAPGRYSASDTAAGGTRGDVRDKWESQMIDHRRKAQRYMGGAAANPDGSISRPQQMPRAARGLPVRPEMRAQEEPEYADNWLGRVEKNRDTMRAGIGDKLGLSDKQMKGIGGGLQGLGQHLMRGGLG